MSGWNQAPLPRDQILLFPETLGDRIPQDHSVRLFAEILDGLDWSRWERHYVLVAGQPPIHPKVVAAAIIYGLTHGIRSSRRLEWARGHAVDFRRSSMIVQRTATIVRRAARRCLIPSRRKSLTGRIMRWSVACWRLIPSRRKGVAPVRHRRTGFTGVRRAQAADWRRIACVGIRGTGRFRMTSMRRRVKRWPPE